MSKNDPLDGAPPALPDAPRPRGLRTWGPFSGTASWKPIMAVYASIPLAVIAIIWLSGDGHLGSTPIWVLAVILAGTSVVDVGACRVDCSPAHAPTARPPGCEYSLDRRTRHCPDTRVTPRRTQQEIVVRQ